MAPSFCDCLIWKGRIAATCTLEYVKIRIEQSLFKGLILESGLADVVALQALAATFGPIKP
jgi:hypothetical protein